MLILSPGPANISDRVRRALTNPDIGHREVEFSDLLTDTRSLLLQICDVPQGFACAVLTGSGTTGIEASITSLPEVASGVLILSNGVYGDRAAQIAQMFGIPFTLENFEWTSPLSLERVEELVRATPYNVVYLVHHETTTGVLNPLKQVADMAKRHGKWVMVDAVSSVACEELDLAGWGLDLIIGSANKCIRGVPGVSFVVISNDFLEVLSKRRQVAFSTDLGGYVNRCVNDIRRRPSQPLIQWRFHPHTVHRGRRLRSTQGPSDARSVLRRPSASSRSPLSPDRPSCSAWRRLSEA